MTKLCTAAECVERPCQMEAHERSPTCGREGAVVSTCMQRQKEAREGSPTCSSACTDTVDANALPVEEEEEAAVRAVLGAEVDAEAAGRTGRGGGSGAT